MYAYIKGACAELYADRAVIEAGGVGYELFCSGKTLNRLHKDDIVKLYTHLHIADDARTLYGFYDEAEKTMFRQLLQVSRVGPKLAVSVLSTLTPSDVATAIFTENEAAFSQVSGMGKKTAQRVLLELRGKVSAADMGAGAAGGGIGDEALTTDIRKEAIAALISLGYDGATAMRAVAAAKEADTVEALITASLRMLAK